MKNAKNIVSNLQECISIIETGTEYEQLHLGAMLESLADMVYVAQGLEEMQNAKQALRSIEDLRKTLEDK